jgi:hypothetical protein
MPWFEANVTRTALGTQLQHAEVQLQAADEAEARQRVEHLLACDEADLWWKTHEMADLEFKDEEIVSIAPLHPIVPDADPHLAREMLLRSLDTIQKLVPGAVYELQQIRDRLNEVVPHVEDWLPKPKRLESP